MRTLFFFSRPFVLVSFLCGILVATGTAQFITGAEYFINNDPGVGSGTAIVGAEGTTLSNLAVSVSRAEFDALPSGLHTLSVRVKGDDEEWSPAVTRTFIKNEVGGTDSGAEIVGAEYFLNQDPGSGKGIPVANDTPGEPWVTVQQVSSTELATLGAGLHWLSFRVQDANGHWSPAISRPFIKDEIGDGPGSLVSHIEYRWHLNGSPVSPAHTLSVPGGLGQAQIQETAVLAGLSEGQTYQLVVRALDNSGRASPATTVEVLIGIGGFPLWETLADVPGNQRGPLDMNGPLALPNLLAYAMGLNPFTATPADLPQLGTLDAVAGTVTFRYRRATGRPGVLLKPVVSSDLKDWQDADTSNLAVLESSDDWEQIELTLTAPPKGHLFLKLLAEQAP